MRPGIVRCVVRLAFCGSLFTFARPASAEEPDMRNIQPFVMLVTDTSGSMEYLPGCVCSTKGCTECLPDCSLTDNSTGKQKNRWAVLLEALTGQFTNFRCKTLDRTDSSQFTYDLGYQKPFNRPWVCPDGSKYCAYPGTESVPIQIQNGLLDNYAGRLQFGLATFDGMRTYVGAGDLVPAPFNTTLSEGAEGSWSYAGPQVVHYPTCGVDHYIDSGIRSFKAPEGGLVSLDTCDTPPCDPSVINSKIQNSLLATRTFGGTPTAGALDDLYYFFKNDYHDKFYKCRPRYAVLISDGYPDDDFREYPVPGCDCLARGNCGSDEDPNLMHCPYPTAVQAATDLKQGRRTKTSSDDPMIQQLFVVGMSVNDEPFAKKSLNAIAAAGGSVDTDGDENEAYFASDPATLTATLDTVLGNVSKPISRSIPAFATGTSGGQYQITTGFGVSTVTVPPDMIPPWKGILERRRFLCDTRNQVTSPTLEDQDRFEVLLNKQSVRSLWTAFPSGATSPVVEGALARGTGAVCGATGCARTELRNVPIALLGSTVNAARQALVMGWMYGDSGSVRANLKLGDIYHSSPVIVGMPTEDPGDQSYALFSQSTLIKNRPTMVYINTNDGILHAFALEDQDPSAGTHKGGEELWGFVPPVLLNDLSPQLSEHRLNLDGTPVVKDVYFSKGTTPLATDYHTVLISGMRGGGKAYFALDVTDPDHPQFMWQFTDTDMGNTYGLPEIVQARYSWPLNSGAPATLRAVAILSGGQGIKDTSGPGCNPGKNTELAMRVPGGGNAVFTTRSDADVTAPLIKHRADIRCWGQTGRALYFVDVETGQLIKKIFESDTDPANGVVFPSPLIGTPTAYQDTVGTVATEGFVLDADGVLWRIDMTETDPRNGPTDGLNGWTVRPFHDLFWDMDPTQGETTYERPILSLDEKHQLVVIVGSGDTDNFEKTEVLNRVVSLTELTTTAIPKVPGDYVAGLNWELRTQTSDTGPGFVKSELVTGSMALFDQQLFIASFIPLSLATDPCAEGLGRLWAVNYRARDTKLVNTDYGNNNTGAVVTYGPQRLTLTSDDTSGSNADLGLFNVAKSSAEQNLLITGLGTTQRITCDPSNGEISNYFSQGATLPIKQQTQPSIWIVAQASSDNTARNRAGSKLGSVEVKMNRPVEFSKVSSWTGSIE